ncbi:SHOCT domain-containing protein [Salinilacihabitans rarus]|uniref:SHOCT domain-containing protein n=1 Tax=Salinilacihabitans rarus TaxID=2961596 RepID=UPI0020C88138|nr:SHOCT domain-containing protein [Salinilacihabitans rarus]
MGLPSWFHEQPPWAAGLSGLLGLLVALTGLSMLLGVVFAAVAVGNELGSVAIGIVVGVVGLAVVLAPFVVAAIVLSRDERGRSDVGPDGEVAALRERYLAGELDEETLERRLDALLDETEQETGLGDSAAAPSRDRTASEEQDQ